MDRACRKYQDRGRQIQGGDPAGQDGFTLLEIIAILILLAILAGVVASGSGVSTADLAAETARLKAHLRYAQVRAMNSNTTWGFAFSGNTYTLQTGGAASATPLPGQNSNSYSLAGGVTATPSTSPITFDQWGSPGTTTITITLSGGGGSNTVTVTKNTGFIP